jgi:hypothetical protein
MERMVRWMSLVAVCLALSNVGFSQASSSSLRGTVMDPSGSAVAGATVVVANDDSKTTRTATTGAVGDYSFLALPPGIYTLTVTAAGFTRYQQTGVQLLVNTPATANVQLRVGGNTESVTVTGEAPILNEVDASLGSSFDQTQVREIPIEGRNVAELLSLQAGVAYTGNRQDIDKDQDTRNGSVNGARSDQSNITLDGVDVNDQGAGYAFTSVLPTTLDSVQEFRVTTANYNADQGTGSGAQVALVTKSGTNKLHGSLYEYHRNTITSANDYFVKGAEARTDSPNVPDKLIRNIFGVSVGGPVRKDRLFFFANYEGTRRREEESTVRTIPSPSLCAGNINYQDALGNPVTVTSGQLQQLDPQGVGINPAIEKADHTGYFDRTFCTGQFATNDPSVGDGFNYSGYRFRAPVKEDNNAFIVRLDYRLSSDGKHSLFWRGALQNLSNPQAPFLPGSPPEATLTDHSKGFALRYTAVLSPNMVNAATWGFTRQSTGVVGNTNQEWNVFYGLDQGIVYGHNTQVPVNNFLDDFSWTKGKHTFQFGGNLGIVRNPRSSLEHSFSLGKGATNWMSPTGFANTATHPSPNSLVCASGGSPLDPCHTIDPATGQPFAEPGSTFTYDYPVLGLMGLVSDIVGNYNYDKQGNVLTKGTPVKRNYGLEWYEFYGQDSWRIKPNLTATFGVRWSLFPPPWEVNGFQATPDVNLGQQFDQIVKNQRQGIGYYAIPLLNFVPGGPANHGPGWYNFEKSDFSPRLSFAYSPRPSGGWLKRIFGEGDKTVFRGGFSKVYDRAGLQLLSTFDANPPGGFGATIQNFCCTPGYDDAAHVPRIADINTIPTCGPVDNCADPANQVFFQPPPPAMHPPAGLQAITWGLDQSIKTPHSWAIDFSVGRELPRKFSFQVAYVGRLGRNLLTQRDLRQPLDIVDPMTGIDYFSAATALAKVAKAQLAAGGINPSTVTDAVVDAVGGPPTSAYWHDMLPPLQAGTAYTSYSGFTSTIPGNKGLIQSVYDLYYDPSLSYLGNEVVGIGNVDLYGGLGDNGGSAAFTYSPCLQPGCTGPGGGGGNYLNNQATSTFAWSSIGKSNYNGLQATLRKQFSNGLQLDLNYTYSKSIDITSSATRLSWSSSVNVGAPGTRLVNAFSPNARRAVSDFDTTHQLNANWMAALPFGKGRRYAADASPVADALIGGWELSGVARWTSGYPFTVDNGNNWATNWDEQGIAQMIAKPKIGHHIDPKGTVSVFADPVAAFNDFQKPFPGQSGSRNAIRGDGYAGLDMALNKRWKMPIEGHSLQFRWEVFNVTNLHRFNALSGLGTQACGCIASLQQVALSSGNTFGNYTGLLTQPRVMQFALRYEF